MCRQSDGAAVGNVGIADAVAIRFGCARTPARRRDRKLHAAAPRRVASASRCLPPSSPCSGARKGPLTASGAPPPPAARWSQSRSRSSTADAACLRSDRDALCSAARQATGPDRDLRGGMRPAQSYPDPMVRKGRSGAYGFGFPAGREPGPVHVHDWISQPLGPLVSVNVICADWLIAAPPCLKL